MYESDIEAILTRRHDNGLILDVCREGGRIRLAPKAPLYPCYTAETAQVMSENTLRTAVISALLRLCVELFLEEVSHGKLLKLPLAIQSYQANQRHLW